MTDVIYKINGYDWFSDLGVLTDADRTTADSFEKPAGILEAEKYQWADGILEVDLLSPVLLKPRTFVVKGTMVFDSLIEYEAGKAYLNTFLYQNYVTLEAVHLDVKANARIQPDGVSWHRLTPLDAPNILVAVTFEFDEIQQDMPFKNEGSEGIFYYYGNTANVPSTPTQIKALSNQMLISTEPVVIGLTTGTVNRIFCVAIPVGKGLITAYDLTSEEDIKSNFSTAYITIDGHNYKLLTMQNALPYSVNHVFQLNIDNG